ncbi:MAG: AmmeMemoRadiSam system protein B [Desulfobulbaceae bacterium]|uniref:MEMO1 family protein H8E79_00045 n=1 Tax=Candidatus Desulfatifera sulfidica TaxID=2841691 RepID=A0A8J6TB25_9BACT|nr:AmmeMemoRadiSam system protein B [Candidatus Desulfatifera sulfidica]
MNRQPVVADRFYPGNRIQLETLIHELSPPPPSKIRQALSVVLPHAGYIYSGAVAAETLARIIIPETVIILGPNHHGQGAEIALSTSTWSMPMGDVPIDMNVAETLLQESDLIATDELSHKFEHSLEVQIPFLQARQQQLKIVPLVISHISHEQCQILGQALARTIRASKKNVLIVASSDMSHYETRESASRKDHTALKHLLDLDPEGLYRTVIGQRISMCGIMPVTTALHAALALGAGQAELVRYTDSGEISGDTNQVVGYAGAVIS